MTPADRMASVLKPTNGGPSPVKIWIGVCAAIAILFGLILTTGRHDQPIRAEEPEDQLVPPSPKLVRVLPAHFPLDTHLPPYRETKASGALNRAAFSPERDLIHFDDKRVWWESDHVKNGKENDHLIHRSMKTPLEKVIEAVCQRGGTLKVQDSYQPGGDHSSSSLHKEGRAIDLTCTALSLETLAKLCWVAGFDWVYYEAKGGAHVHCSVRASPCPD